MRLIAMIVLLTLSAVGYAEGQWKNRQAFGYWVVQEYSKRDMEDVKHTMLQATTGRKLYGKLRVDITLVWTTIDEDEYFGDLPFRLRVEFPEIDDQISNVKSLAIIDEDNGNAYALERTEAYCGDGQSCVRKNNQIEVGLTDTDLVRLKNYDAIGIILTTPEMESSGDDAKLKLSLGDSADQAITNMQRRADRTYERFKKVRKEEREEYCDQMRAAGKADETSKCLTQEKRDKLGLDDPPPGENENFAEEYRELVEEAREAAKKTD